MADISKIKLQNGTTYNLKDNEARGSIGASTSKSHFGITLSRANWQGSGTNWTYNLPGSTFNPALRATHPPIVVCTDTDKTNYNYLTNAMATPGAGITFTAHTKPGADIHLIVIDLG